jgi:hypothetical protein
MTDKTYLVEIVRPDLDGFTNRVANEEAGASEFVDSRVQALDGRPTNLATFRELGPGELLDPPRFLRLGQGPADGRALWTGVVLIGGLNVAVQLFR